MAIRFVPEPGMVLMCDYNTGFIAPEMVKVRHSIVVSPKIQNSQGLCIVVPISSVRPNPVLAYHYRFMPNAYPFFTPGRPHCAKCDMVSHVSHARLDRVQIRGKYESLKITAADLEAIRNCLLSAIGMAALKRK